MKHFSSNNLSDKYLVDKVLSGDSQAFGIIVQDTQALVARIVFRMIGHAEDRKDLAQDIYLKTFRSLPQFRFQSKLSTWIAKVAYNTCLTHLDKEKPVLMDDLGGMPVQDTGDTEDAFTQKELLEILQYEIEGLPPVYKTLITLYHQQDLGYDEIGQITGLPPGTVKSYLFRARRRLKDNLLLKFKKEDL